MKTVIKKYFIFIGLLFVLPIYPSNQTVWSKITDWFNKPWFVKSNFNRTQTHATSLPLRSSTSMLLQKSYANYLPYIAMIGTASTALGALYLLHRSDQKNRRNLIKT